MKKYKIKLFLAVVFELLWHILARPIVPIMCLFMRKTDVNNKPIWYPHEEVQRYRLPHWMSFAETPDERLPGGLYEPTVNKIYQAALKYTNVWVASYITSVYWLGHRNVGQGILWPFGKVVGEDHLNMAPEEIKDKYGVWQKEKEIWIPFLRFEKWKPVFYKKPVYVYWGWEVNQDWQNLETEDHGHWAVPGYFSIRFSEKGNNL